MKSENVTNRQRYTNGVWYDSSSHDFCRVREKSDGSVVLVTPDGDDEWYEYSGWGEFPEEDYIQIDEKAVENPAEYVEEGIEELISGVHNGDSIPFHLEISLEYARLQTEIVEIDGD